MVRGARVGELTTFERIMPSRWTPSDGTDTFDSVDMSVVVFLKGVEAALRSESGGGVMLFSISPDSRTTKL